MIADVDSSLAALLAVELGKPLPFDVSFALPGKDFKPMSETKPTLNCYLYDIREDRDLRDVEPRIRRGAEGTLEKFYPPARVRLTYCLTAWSPAKGPPAVDPVTEEHTLLGNVLRILLKYPVLPPQARVGALAGQDLPPPTSVILPEDMRSNRDFWNAVGSALRPALDYGITVALTYQDDTTGPMVQTVRLGVAPIAPGARPPAPPTSTAPSGAVGGTVWDAASPPRPVASAWVRIQETGQTAVTDEGGHFIFDRLIPGDYTLAVRAVGFREGSRPVHVPPQAGGGFDLRLVLL